MRKQVLVIAPHGSYRTVPFITVAKSMNLDILIASEGKHSIVDFYANGLHINLHDLPEALTLIKEEAKNKPFVGIIGTDDSSTELAAQAAQALNLPHNTVAAVQFTRRKDFARQRLYENGVRVPKHTRIDLNSPVSTQIDSIEFPCVIKPIALSASQGVIRADNQQEFFLACERIRRIVIKENIDRELQRFLLVESFIPGIEVAVEGLLNSGQFQLLAIMDKPDPLNGPYFEETYYITPSRLSGETQQKICEEVSLACQAYGLREGPVHAECRINYEGVWILEVAARTIGGLCSRLLHFSTGYHLEELVLRHAMGDPIELKISAEAAGVLMIPISKGGILRRVEGITAAQQVTHIEQIDIQIREGYELVPLPEGSSYLGFIFARGPSPDSVEEALRTAHQCLNFVIAPIWKGTVEFNSQT